MKLRTLLATFAVVIACLDLKAQEIPPRIEIGPILSRIRNCTYCDFQTAGGARITVNVNRYIGAEVESIRLSSPARYSTDDFGTELHTMISGKGTYRIEKGRLLKFAGLDFFGLAGVGFLNRPVSIADPNPPPFCIRCATLRQQTKATFHFGGGLELVPARIVAIRFDVTGTRFSQEDPFSTYPAYETRLYLKLSTMFRFP